MYKIISKNNAKVENISYKNIDLKSEKKLKAISYRFSYYENLKISFPRDTYSDFYPNKVICCKTNLLSFVDYY